MLSTQSVSYERAEEKFGNKSFFGLLLPPSHPIIIHSFHKRTQPATVASRGSLRLLIVENNRKPASKKSPAPAEVVVAVV